ncbi:MAG: hypothetical protein AVDCRST_MAG95-1581 [uncultured Adhaeribacter sp.]|uniref:DUF4168 domain-containing protein n=1 Tax=uncultured Adhaeribacter sp. TaxID=448109 RepID=A0A6J4I792_9BACT|nr:MAG: hypothetical protein AVDCRST_MAG95-1581 [uncultured Adhaeribacter sp.]
MKKIFTSALLVFSLYLSTMAPLAVAATGPDEQLKMQAIEQTRQLAARIGLNEADYIRVKNITFQKLVALKEAEEMYAHHAEMRVKKIQAIEEAFNQSMASALPARQHKEYVALAQTK